MSFLCWFLVIKLIVVHTNGLYIEFLKSGFHIRKLHNVTADFKLIDDQLEEFETFCNLYPAENTTDIWKHSINLTSSSRRQPVDTTSQLKKQHLFNLQPRCDARPKFRKWYPSKKVSLPKTNLRVSPLENAAVQLIENVNIQPSAPIIIDDVGRLKCCATIIL